MTLISLRNANGSIHLKLTVNFIRINGSVLILLIGGMLQDQNDTWWTIKTWLQSIQYHFIVSGMPSPLPIPPLFPLQFIFIFFSKRFRTICHHNSLVFFFPRHFICVRKKKINKQSHDSGRRRWRKILLN